VAAPASFAAGAAGAAFGFVVFSGAAGVVVSWVVVGVLAGAT
jgi:hypothetical protein